MAVSTARPGVRRGYVSEKSQRRLLIAVLVAALMPTAYATCATADERHCTCPIQGNVIECYLGGNYAQVPPFRPSNNVYDTVTIRGKSSSLTMQAGAFKNIKMERIEILFKGTMSLEPGAFAGVDGELSELTIGKTLLESIPDEAFAGLGQLTYLNLDQNHLKTVTHRMFSDLSKLEELNLNNNQIVTIHDNAFDDLGQLRYLYIGNNRLKAVNHTMFSHLSHLEVLVLYDNQLETIHDDAFLGLAGLLHLSLLKNRLSSLSVSLARTMSHLERVDLRDNPLVCDCQLAWLQTRAKRINVYGVCTNPPTARGQSVASYDTSLCSHDNTTNTGTVSFYHAFIYKNTKQQQCYPPGVR